MTDNPASKADIPEDVAQLSFEQALEELEGLVRRLEGEQATLDEAITAYTRGTQLKRHCEAKLAEARERVEKITLDANGEPATQPFDPQ